MLEEQVAALTGVLKNEDIQNYAGDSFYNLIKVVLFHDGGAAMDGIKDVKDIIFHIPTALFWDKMQRYLYGTFKSYSEQVEMSNKFSGDNADYNAFVKRQMQLIDKIDDDAKVDYFANLTRCFLLTEMNVALYYKLANFLNLCTSEELTYIKDFGNDKKSDLNVMIASLYQYGLYEQDGTYYVLSDFGKALKADSLNFDEPAMCRNRILSYDQMKPLKIDGPMAVDEVQRILST